MKKAMSILCSMMLVLSCFVLFGCSKENKDVSNSKYLGTWRCVDVEVFGEHQKPEEVFENAGVVELVLNSDGTGTFSGTEEGAEVTNFTWVETSEGVKTSGDSSMTFKEKDGQLVTDILTVKLYFDKQ